MTYPMEDLLLDLQKHHSLMQIDMFITAKTGVTIYGCFKQALRELNTRRGSLRELTYASAKLRKKITKANAAGNRDKMLYLIGCMEDTLHSKMEIQREHDRFYEQACFLRKRLEEAGYTFPLSQQVRYELELDMWFNILKCNMAIELQTPHGLTKPTMEGIRALPAAERSILVDYLRVPSELINWFRTSEIEHLRCLELWPSRTPSSDTSLIISSTSHENSLSSDCLHASPVQIEQV